MTRASWWKETMAWRFVLVAGAAAVVFVFVFVAPWLANWLDGRAAALLRPPVALALLAGWLVFGHDRLTARHRRHDKRGD